ncbi:hypothetical protein EB796_019294 [Bugula neritina]|uniref:Uncharacterized protein n=1 Tax=Bugula neritina TaxID=10212 RepID=A0A7J7JAK5_BUGNE|nr:hypothetical protein EB796_019294 [Bugula neritina]
MLPTLSYIWYWTLTSVEYLSVQAISSPGRLSSQPIQLTASKRHVRKKALEKTDDYHHYDEVKIENLDDNVTVSILQEPQSLQKPSIKGAVLVNKDSLMMYRSQLTLPQPIK